MAEEWVLGAEASLLRVRGAGDRSVGVGVLIGPRTALTCAHVVNAALGRSAREQAVPGESVSVDFPLLGAPSRRAAVVRWAPPPAKGSSTGDDIAGLELDAGAPLGARPAVFRGDPPGPGVVVQLFGLPERRPDGVWALATVRGRVANGRLQLDGEPAAAWRAQPGFSGGPVFESGSGLVVGLLAETGSVQAGDRDGYAVPVEQISRLWAAGLTVRGASATAAAQPDAGAVRRLLDDALSGEDLDDLTLDHFPDVYRNFSAGTGRRAKIRQLVEFAARQEQLRELVTLVRTINPAAYDRYAESLLR
jgi:hypothetical protein